MIKVKFIKEFESDRLYKVGDEAEFEDQKARNLVSVELAEYVGKEQQAENKEEKTDE